MWTTYYQTKPFSYKTNGISIYRLTNEENSQNIRCQIQNSNYWTVRYRIRKSYRLATFANCIMKQINETSPTFNLVGNSVMPRAYIKNIKVGIQFDDRDTVHNKVCWSKNRHMFHTSATWYFL
jgi:hypothetical protein